MARINFLPPWVETNLQPAFYDLESGTCLQQTARMYDKVNQLVRSVNEQNDIIADYIQQFIDLKDYVEDYFENLDVQEEINNKLDAMVEDGTFLTLITPIVQDDMATLTAEINATKDEADETLSQAQTLNTKADKVLQQSIKDYRKVHYPLFQPVTLPANITDTFFTNFEILSNNEGKYVVNFNEDNFINESANTIYLAPDGANTNDGSYEHPKLSFSSAYNTANAGDTICFKDGMYSRSQLQMSESANYIAKSLNIIGEHKDKVFLTSADFDYTWSQNDTYSDVYEVTRSGIRQVIDITRKDENIYNRLTQVSSLLECHETENSWCQSGSTCYVHMYGNVAPSSDTIILGLSLGQAPLVALGFNSSAKIYIKDLNIIDGDRGGIITNSNGQDVTVFIENVDIYNISCAGYARDGYSNIGCKSICKNVHMGNIDKDGFNYHANSSTQAIGIEIDCSCFNTGHDESGSGHTSNNATTAHEYAQVVRVNGNYGYAHGAVVADVNNVNSVLYGCVSVDGYGTTDYDILAQTDTVIYLYNCNTIGSRAGYNLVTSGANAHIYYNNGTTFDTKIGNVTPIE